MAIAETNELTFGGVDSTEYGIVIAGPGEYGAPTRATESFYVPGRNGALVVDKGYYENILIEYDVVVQASTQQEFLEAVSDYRNAIVSLTGYQRLTDKYHPDEYRIARYSGGFDEDPDFRGSNAVFTLKFDCKPQRFLTDGETAEAVTSGGTITNPTLFESKPMLLVEGYGDIDIDGQQIVVENVPVGDVFLANGESFSIEYPNVDSFGQYDELAAYEFEAGKLKTGDNIYVAKSTFIVDYIVDSKLALGDTLLDLTITAQTGAGANTTAVIRDDLNGSITTTFDPITFMMGTASSVTHYFECKEKIGTVSRYEEATHRSTVVIDYDGANKITFSAQRIDSDNFRKSIGSGTLGDATGYSTLTVSGVISIDLDVGEAYWTSSGDVISADFAVSLPAELPTLAPGTNTITYDNTFTSFQIVPRWWKI